MKKLIGAAITAVALLAGFSDACYDPLAIYYGGIVLNNGEEIDYQKLEEVAGDASAYIKECFIQKLTEETPGGGIATESVDSQIVMPKIRNTTDDPETVELCSYKLRSVYNDEAMVFIGHVEGMFELFGDVPRLIVYFPVDSNNIPTTEEKAAAVAAELNRFATLGIITITSETILKVQAALAIAQGQYWAAEDSVLSFNMWFGGEGVNGVRAVDGVKGTYGVSSCGSGVGYDLPDRGLTGVAHSGMSLSAKGNAPIRIEMTGNGVAVHYSTVATTNAVMRIFDMQARLVDEIALARNTSSIRIIGRNTMAPGCYLLSILEAGRVSQRGTMTLFR